MSTKIPEERSADREFPARSCAGEERTANRHRSNCRAARVLPSFSGPAMLGPAEQPLKTLPRSSAPRDDRRCVSWERIVVLPIDRELR